ncbi:MAG: tRNA (adenosine(37)-N6)-threonylcarbamoyltransferase complex ATPase subunit type 1 TsaE [Clostridiales bacterium]|nr:tRNA (adenosine(37)-N6)-threonylcarbamoyltransferase complex ATPase subunit type 1 TsaE [Clostridiales bacterium]
MRIYESFSYEDTQKIASEIADTLKGDEFIAMYGDLGAGKTAFVQGLARALGITDHITSPTFTIVNEYEGRVPLYHFDVYRISDPDEMYEIGYEEYVDTDGICIVEWAELIEDLFPPKYYKITILKDTEKDFDYRKIIFEEIEV